jgi:hypothetical protein
LEEQIGELQLQNREKQDRLADLTYQLALERHLRLKITAFTWEEGFYPIVGLTISHPINVTVQNDDIIPVSGLTLTFTLINKDKLDKKYYIVKCREHCLYFSAQLILAVTAE